MVSLQAWYTEDVTGLPGYPVVPCGVDATQFNKVPFGGGVLILAYNFGNITANTSEYFDDKYPSHNVITCLGQRQWNTAIITTPEMFVSAPVCACVHQCVYVCSTVLLSHDRRVGRVTVRHTCYF